MKKVDWEWPMSIYSLVLKLFSFNTKETSSKYINIHGICSILYMEQPYFVRLVLFFLISYLF